MSIFFIDNSNIIGDKAYIRGNDVNHIRNVLRKKIGDTIKLSTGTGLVYTSEIIMFTSDEISCTIIDCDGGNSELRTKITLFQGIPKKDKMDLIIQKTVELGIFEIVPVLMDRTIVKLDSKKEYKRLERWQTISMNAAKQSGRLIVPQISPIVTFNQAIERARQLEYNLIPYENEKGMVKTRTSVEEAIKKNSIGIFIGPEGGISPHELELATSIGAVPISLGNRILRTETAGFSILSVLSFYIEV